jgi:cold shock protein
MQGKIKWFNEQKKFGFVTSDTGEDVFIHISDVPLGATLKEGDRIMFEVGQAPKGTKAINIKFLD